MLTFIRYIEVYFTFAFLDCVRYNDDFVKSSFCSIHFTVILAGLKKIVLYTTDFVIQRFVKSKFHCNKDNKATRTAFLWAMHQGARIST